MKLRFDLIHGPLVVLPTVLCLLMCLAAPPADAFWPVLQQEELCRTGCVSSYCGTIDVEASTVPTSPDGGEVHYSVYDPRLNKLVEGLQTYSAWDRSSPDLIVVNGIVAWVEEPSQSRYTVHYAVYEPCSAKWAMHQQGSYFSPPTVTIEDGVVAWTARESSRTWVGGAIYDPARQTWIAFPSQSYSGTIYPFKNADGVIAWVRSEGVSLGAEVHYAVYDPQSPGPGWKPGVIYCPEGIISTSFTITAGTVGWISSQHVYLRGYDPDAHTWYAGKTKTLAYFVACPDTIQTSRWVWFTDMSLGGAQWQWKFGDGTTDCHRSTWHFYPTSGCYTATETVTGPTRTDAANLLLRGDFQNPTSSIAINGGAQYTNSRSVTLTLNSTDDSGTIAGMQFYNEGEAWTAWEPYATTKAWTLTNGEGSKTVYARFKDHCDNISLTRSAGITLETAAPQVKETTPLDEAKDVPLDTNITVKFSKIVDCATVTSETFYLKVGDDVVSGGVSCSGDTATFTPSANLACDTTYTAGATTEIKDRAGNALSKNVEWTFSTPATPQCAVEITSPADQTTVCGESLRISGSASTCTSKVTWGNDRDGLCGDCTGTTSWSATVVLRPGLNTITVMARMSEQETCTDQVSVFYAQDTTAPLVAITTQTVNPGGTLDLGGTATDDTSVAMATWRNGATGESGTASLDCSNPQTCAWSAKGIRLACGFNTVTVTARDVCGKSAAAQVTVNYQDEAPPVVTASAPSVQTCPAMSTLGQVTDNCGVARARWTIAWPDGGSAGGACSLSSCAGSPVSCVWSATGIPLHVGANTLTVTAYDTGGNSDSVTVPVTCEDSDPPFVRITSPTSAGTYRTCDSALDIGGTAYDCFGIQGIEWTVTCVADGSTHSVKCSGAATWSVADIPLCPGLNLITVTATDASGLAGAATLEVTRVACEVRITTPTTEDTYCAGVSTLNIAGTASECATKVTWANDRGGSGTCKGTTAWSAQVTIRSGRNIITVTATDSAGNTCQDILTVNTLSVSLAADPATIRACESATLSWSSTCAASVASSNFGAADVSGSKAVSPTRTTTYTIRVRSADGKTASASARVTVRPVYPKVWLTAEPISITEGESATLNWHSTDAVRIVSSNFGAADVGGSVVVSPVRTTTYRIVVASCDNHTARAYVTVKVKPLIPSVTLTASPTSIQPGESAALTWNSTNAVAVVSSSFEAEDVNGIKVVSPTRTTSYTITVRTAGGIKASARARVTVS